MKVYIVTYHLLSSLYFTVKFNSLTGHPVIPFSIGLTSNISISALYLISVVTNENPPSYPLLYFFVSLLFSVSLGRTVTGRSVIGSLSTVICFYGQYQRNCSKRVISPFTKFDGTNSVYGILGEIND